MLIKQESTILKESFKILGGILLFIFLWTGSCSDNKPATAKVKVKTPEIKNSFNAKAPEHKPIENNPVNQVKNDGIVYVENPLYQKLFQENEQLKLNFLKLNDSMKLISYEKSIKLNEFAVRFEDENITINMNGIVQGEVKSIVPEYIWKEKTFDVEIKPKEDKFKLLGGLEIGNNIQLDNFNIKANLMFQNSKGNIFSLSGDIEKNYYLGYTTVLF